jgi:hypothetical protein
MSVRARDVKMSPEAAATMDALVSSREPEARSILRRVRLLRDILLANCLYGEVIPKALIPRQIRSRFGLTNLYVEDLPSFWRLLYAVANDEDGRYVVVLAIVDHQTYSRWFGHD